jgi:hypothetical protein
MYLVRVDQAARDDIAAAAAVHGELGREYHGALAEGLVERIGDEIDKRVDARLAQYGQPPPTQFAPPQALQPSRGRSPWAALVLGLGSIGLGVAATGITLAASTTIGATSAAPGPGNAVIGSVHTSVGPGQLLLVMVIWIAIAVVNVAYARRH